MTYDGEYYCADCVDELFIWSEMMGEYIKECDAIKVYTDGYMREWDFATEDYANRNCYYDSDVEEYFDAIECGCTDAYGDFICESNYEDHYFYCEGCNNVYHNDDAYYLDSDGCYYCHDCYEEHHTQYIYDYHHFNDWKLFQNDNEESVPFYIGFELEIDNDGDYDIEQVHDLITSNINCVLMHDGSLSSRGIEIVSHPQSYKYITAQEEKYKELFQKLTHDYSFTSHENGRCGLHFHITRPSDEIVDRIELIIENFKDELYAFSRRTDNHWCRYLGETTNVSSDEVKSLAYIKKHKGTCDRYMALNLTNSRTIEFRMMRGTLNYNTFRASLDLINEIVTIASDTSRDLTQLNWSDLVGATDYIKDYCILKNLDSIKKTLVDNSKKLEDRDARIRTYIIKYDAFINNYKKHLIKQWNSKASKIETSGDLATLSNNASRTYRTIENLNDLQRWIGECVASSDINRLKYNINDTAYKIASEDKWYASRYKTIMKEVEIVCAL